MRKWYNNNNKKRTTTLCSVSVYVCERASGYEIGNFRWDIETEHTHTRNTIEQTHNIVQYNIDGNIKSKCVLYIHMYWHARTLIALTTTQNHVREAERKRD